MRGQPFLQLLLVIAAFVALGWPVRRLTRPATVDANLAPMPDAGAVPAETELALTVTCVPAPEEFNVQSLGREVLAGNGPRTEWTGPWRIRLPAEGADLALRARWSAVDTPAAARIVVRFSDQRPPVERTFWASHGRLTELVTIPGVGP